MSFRHNDAVSRIIAAHRSLSNSESISWLGHDFVVHPGVFSPFIAPSGLATRSLVSIIDFTEKNVWELGCGAAIFGCASALCGARHVLVTDISDAAIENAKENISNLRLSNIVTVRKGSLFEPLRTNEKFDLVYVDLPLADAVPNDDLVLQLRIDHGDCPLLL
jgi:methylase of polypeptide subunit release factors